MKAELSRYKVMKLIILSIFFFPVFLTFGQDPVVELNIKVKDEFTGKALYGARVEIYKDDKLFAVDSNSFFGVMDEFELPLNSHYIVWVKAEGYVSKMATVNTSWEHPEDLPPFIPFPVQTTLFEECGLDFEFLQTESLIDLSMDSLYGNQVWDHEHTKMMLKKIEKVRNGAVNQDERLQYDAHHAAADSLALKYEYDLAVKEIEDASHISTCSHEAKKIERFKYEKGQHEKFLKAVAKGDELFEVGDYKLAARNYGIAKDIHPDDVSVKIKALNCESKQLLKKANEVFEEKNYSQAEKYYERALSLNPEDQMVIDRLAEIERLRFDNIDETERANQYANHIAKGDEYFNKQEYYRAKEAYSLALRYEKDEQYPKEQIKLCQNFLDKQSDINADK